MVLYKLAAIAQVIVGNVGVSFAMGYGLWWGRSNATGHQGGSPINSVLSITFHWVARCAPFHVLKHMAAPLWITQLDTEFCTGKDFVCRISKLTCRAQRLFRHHYSINDHFGLLKNPFFILTFPAKSE
jgi:hypothetical protein